MTTLRQAAQLALDWLYENDIVHPSKVSQNLRAALEQPKGLFIDMIAAHGPEFVEEVRRVGENIEQQAEPVAWVFAPNNELLWPSEVEVTNPIEIDSYQPLYTAPPQRKPLSEKEAHALIMEDYLMEDEFASAMELIRRVEQAHGIKETP